MRKNRRNHIAAVWVATCEGKNVGLVSRGYDETNIHVLQRLERCGYYKDN